MQECSCQALLDIVRNSQLQLLPSLFAAVGRKLRKNELFSASEGVSETSWHVEACPHYANLTGTWHNPPWPQNSSGITWRQVQPSCHIAVGLNFCHNMIGLDCNLSTYAGKAFTWGLPHLWQPRTASILFNCVTTVPMLWQISSMNDFPDLMMMRMDYQVINGLGANAHCTYWTGFYVGLKSGVCSLCQPWGM